MATKSNTAMVQYEGAGVASATDRHEQPRPNDAAGHPDARYLGEVEAVSSLRRRVA